jgi:hypothetical protein
VFPFLRMYSTFVGTKPVKMSETEAGMGSTEHSQKETHSLAVTPDPNSVEPVEVISFSEVKDRRGKLSKNLASLRDLSLRLKVIESYDELSDNYERVKGRRRGLKANFTKYFNKATEALHREVKATNSELSDLRQRLDLAYWQVTIFSEKLAGRWKLEGSTPKSKEEDECRLKDENYCLDIYTKHSSVSKKFARILDQWIEDDLEPDLLSFPPQGSDAAHLQKTGVLESVSSSSSQLQYAEADQLTMTTKILKNKCFSHS